MALCVLKLWWAQADSACKIMTDGRDCVYSRCGGVCRRGSGGPVARDPPSKICVCLISYGMCTCVCGMWCVNPDCAGGGVGGTAVRDPPGGVAWKPTSPPAGAGGGARGVLPGEGGGASEGVCCFS